MSTNKPEKQSKNISDLMIEICCMASIFMCRLYIECVNCPLNVYKQPCVLTKVNKYEVQNCESCFKTIKNLRHN